MASAAPTAAEKGKGKATDSATAKSTTTPATAQSKTPAAGSTPLVAGTNGDWSAVWSAERNAYYFWQRSTGKTTWENPFANGSATQEQESKPSAEAESTKDGTTEAKEGATPGSKSVVPEAGSSKDTPGSTSQPPLPQGNSPAPEQTQDYGGIDPDLAYLDPSLAARGRGGDAVYKARFNARTGRFEGDPTKNPERISEFERSKRQNSFYFDYENWSKAEALKQEQAAAKRSADDAGLGGQSGKDFRRPSKKEMEAIRARNKEKKEKRQKGWLLDG